MPPALIPGKELVAVSIRRGNGPGRFHTQQEGTDVQPARDYKKNTDFGKKEKEHLKKTCVLAKIRIDQGTTESGSSGTSSKESDDILYF
jgi:hypothetical protein